MRLASANDRQKSNKCQQNVNIVEFHNHIWNHHEKCIQISTNMPGIGSLIREIDVKFKENMKKHKYFCSVKPMPAL